MIPLRGLVAAGVVVGVVSGGALLNGQSKAKAPAKMPKAAVDFYLQYRKAFDAATRIDELLPYMSAERRQEIEETPAKERAEMFELVKLVGVKKGLKILRETPTAEGVTLAVEALDVDRNPSTGTITLVREDGEFRIAQESWRSRAVSPP